MFWLLSYATFSWTVTINCAQVQRGIIKSDGSTIKDIYLEENANIVNMHYSGPYCADVEGYHEIRFRGRQHHDITYFGDFVMTNMKVGYLARCLKDSDSKKKTIYLTKNRCYAFDIIINHYCSIYNNIVILEMMKPGTDVYEPIGELNSIINKTYNDCVDGF